MTVTAKTRVPLAKAEQIARYLVDDLEDVCERIEIVGSIRRRRPTVSDIELLVVPRIDVIRRDLFGDPDQTVNRFDERCKNLHGLGTLSNRLDVNGRPAWGERYKRVLYEGIGVDLFSVLPPAQFGVLMVIRTGSAEFSKRVVSQARKGGALPNEMFVADGQLFLKRWGDYPELIPTPTEQDFFDRIGMPFIDPSERT